MIFGDFFSELFNGNFVPETIEANREKQLIAFTIDDFNDMLTEMEKSINRNTLGLDDIMLKKIILTWHTGRYSKDTDILMELTPEEAEICKNDPLCPYEVIKGGDLPQVNQNIIDIASSHVKQFFETDDNAEAAIQSERQRKQKMQNTNYLYAKGVITFLNEDGEEMLYYYDEILQDLYKEYEDKKDWYKRNYAEDIWEYLSSKCYTDGRSGIKVYGKETIEEEVVDWSYNDDHPTDFTMKRQLISDFDKKRETQELEYYSLVAQYSTPIELMVDLLNISSSKEFVDAFIDKVANETSVTVKVYKVSSSSGTTITKELEEKTTVRAEAVVTANVVKYDIDGDGKGYFEGANGIDVKVTLDDQDILWGLSTNLKIKLDFSDIPENVQGILVDVYWADGGTTQTYEFPGGFASIGNLVTDNLGTTHTEKITAWFTDRYKSNWTVGDVNRVTRTLTTETHLDLAVENAVTWYAKVNNNNYIQRIEENTTKDEYGNIVESNTPIMVSKTRSDITYTRNNSNKNTIFNSNTSVLEMNLEQVGANVEDWYANLTADNVCFWATGGPLTHEIYQWLDGDPSRKLCTEYELLNIQYKYAIEDGLFQDIDENKYTPIDIKFHANTYSEGYLKTEVNMELVQGVSTVEDNTDFFLSLLKNSTGIYNKNAAYDPNGKEIKYKNIYNSEVRVGRYLINGAAMLYELLNSSPNTQALTPEMKSAMYKYINEIGNVSEWEFDQFDEEEFLPIFNPVS